MRKFKKLSALILAILIVVLSLPTATVFADTPNRYGRNVLGQMDDGANLQAIYDKLVIACDGNTPDKVDINTDWRITAAQLNTVYKMFYRDYPEYFWIKNGGYSYSSIVGQDVVASISPKYIEDFSDLATAKNAYNEKIDSLTSGLNGKSEYEKAKILHDRLASTVTYKITGAKDQTSYGALVEGEAVCNGYTRAYQHLMQEVGISTWYVSGSSYDPNTDVLVAHAWNLVNINNAWYYTDVTWDDQGDSLFYAYFNITTAQLKEGHIIGEFEEYLPNATATNNNYFVKENLIFSSFDKDRLINLLDNSEFIIQIYVSGNLEDFISQLRNSKREIAVALGAVGYYSYSTNSVGNALIIDFDITVPCSHKYSNACDADCNLCGELRTPSAHRYDNDSDTICNVCGAERTITDIPESWDIDITKTGVYSIKPSKTLPGFNTNSITVFDKSGNEVKYNDAKQGWPLVKDQEYTIKLTNEIQNYDIDWNLNLNTDTIFSDVSASQWYNNAVTYAVGAGIISGYGGTTKFGPGDNIQRQDFLVILARLDGVDLTKYGNKKSAFSDVPEGSYYEAAVNWGAENGIVSGYANGKFGTGDKITREQLVTFLYRYANYKRLDTSYTNTQKNKVKNTYKDFKNVTDYAQDPIIWAVSNGVISGKSSNTIAPGGNALRCEVAQIMYNIFLKDIFK